MLPNAETENTKTQPAPDAVAQTMDMAVWFNGHIIQCRPDRERKGTTLTAARARYAAMVKALAGMSDAGRMLANYVDAAIIAGAYSPADALAARQWVDDFRAARSQAGA